MIPIKILTGEDFGQYGTIIGYDEADSHPFQVVLSEPEAIGWRIAVKQTVDRELAELGRHPDSRESFEPMQGVTLLCVAPPENPEAVAVFMLDRSVCLFKNVWHNTVTLSAASLIKVTENNRVGSENYLMKTKLVFGAILGR
jgi:ureidoglycolate hydrolase